MRQIPVEWRISTDQGVTQIRGIVPLKIRKLPRFWNGVELLMSGDGSGEFCFFIMFCGVLFD